MGSDAEEEKTTYVTLLGLEEAEKRAKDYTGQAFEALAAFAETDFLKDLTEMLLTREK